ncbi:MAG: hypothetical protein AABZ60_12830 [Planctomycetota bacterium]
MLKYYKDGIDQVLKGEFNIAFQIIIQQSLIQESFCVFVLGKVSEIAKELGLLMELHRIYIAESGFVGFMVEFTDSRKESDLLISLIDFPYLFTKEINSLVHHLGYKVHWPLPKEFRDFRRYSNCLEFPGDEVQEEDWSDIGLHLSTKFLPICANQRENQILHRVISIDGDNYLLSHQKEFVPNYSS